MLTSTRFVICWTRPIDAAGKRTMRRNVHITPLAVFILVWLGLYLPQAGLTEENVIHVDIDRMHSDKGRVFCALYSSANGFPKDSRRAIARTNSSISNGKASCEFSGIKPGTYAVSVFHDENSNGRLDTNFLGIPREGVGASNDARGHLGPPKFDAAAFQFSGGRLNLKITINYL